MQGQRAGVVSRFLAAGIDLLVVVATLAGVYLAYSGVRFLLTPRRFSWPEPSELNLVMLGWILLVVYLTVGWANTGRTFGKTILGLRVVNVNGGRLRLPRAFARALLCAAFPIGLLWSAVSSGSTSVQDLIVRTAVVYDWEPRLQRIDTT